MEYWSSLASLLGVLAFFQTLIQIVFPPELRFAIIKLFNKIFSNFSPYILFDITEIDGVNTNELYSAVQLYLSSSVSSAVTRLSLSRTLNSTAITFNLSNNDSIYDDFNGVSVQWEHIVIQRQSQSFSWRPFPDEKRGFTLKIKKQDKVLILDSYLDHIIEKANEIRRKNQDRFLFTNPRGSSHSWEAVPFKHPSMFSTLAIDPTKKREIMEDLKDFVNGKSFYQKTGRAWKRGYLLYGPPGTGKSSMIAAMANFLGFDIFDLELSEVHNNSELRKLLMKTTPKSIIVIEDIDCSINLSNRKKMKNKKKNVDFTNLGNEDYGNGNSVTLSGLLNFTDGLWSCCGSERIFVFTTNHIDKLDPALLRSGRMDMHIFMSYCSFPSLKILLKNYLDWEEDDYSDKAVLSELEENIEKAEMTPADVSEVLIKNRTDKNRAMRKLLEELKLRVKGKFNNGVSRKKDLDHGEEEEEEQEKRELENPKESGKNQRGDEKED